MNPLLLSGYGVKMKVIDLDHASVPNSMNYTFMFSSFDSGQQALVSADFEIVATNWWFA